MATTSTCFDKTPIRVYFLLGCSALGMLLILAQEPNPDIISIDCGAPNDYFNQELNIYYKTDATFVVSGSGVYKTNIEVADPNKVGLKLYSSLRNFPNGSRNCYTLRTRRGRGHKYITRAYFYYGNYDNKNQVPIFDIHIGVNYWATINTDLALYVELILISLEDDIQICLINTGNGVPFISAIELRLFDDSAYEILDSTALSFKTRLNIGGDQPIRYPKDIYDRIWYAAPFDIYDPTIEWSTSNFPMATPENYDGRIPTEVLQTTARSKDNSSFIFIYKPVMRNEASSYNCCLYFHFMEVEVLPNGERRQFNVYANNQDVGSVVNLEYLKPQTIISPLFDALKFNITMVSTNQSSMYPPFLNALEAFAVIELPNVPSAFDDVNAANNIKEVYNMTKISWQGDPCVPTSYAWDGLKCSYNVTPRIISMNLSSSGLKGIIANSFFNLSNLEFLDLSHNQLTGAVPEFFAKMTNIKWIDLSGNNLNGSISKDLRKRISDGTLNISLDGNAITSSGKSNHHLVVPLSVAFSALLIILILVVVWRMRNNSEGSNVGTIKSKNRPFSYSKVLRITNNLREVIGEGGFGKVYLGVLDNNTRVAVKMLSRTSKQGYKQFQAEVQLLMVVHHRNLVSLLGYCNQSEHLALVYEFMANGNLRQHLSERSANVLSWRRRIQIAVEAAQGLDYLHNGCRPSIIHRDLKTTNILLNEQMQAKISDFGLSRAFSNENESFISTQPVGTLGYLDPDVQSLGHFNQKSDVYSFGIVLFELITAELALKRGQDNNGYIHILETVMPTIEMGDIRGIVDPRLEGQFDLNSAWKVVEIAMSCVARAGSQRPEIGNVLMELKECWSMTEMVARDPQSKVMECSGFDISPHESIYEMRSMETDGYSVPTAR